MKSVIIDDSLVLFSDCFLPILANIMILDKKRNNDLVIVSRETLHAIIQNF